MAVLHAIVVIVELVTQPIDAHVEKLTYLEPTFSCVKRTVKTIRTALSTMALRTVNINSKWHIL